MQGKITRVTDKGFFFVDTDYFCHNSKVKFEPREGDIVDYQPKQTDRGKNADRVVFVKSPENSPVVVATDVFSLYLSALDKGYFSEDGHILPEFIEKYPVYLAKVLSGDSNVNKSTQIQKFFGHCRKTEGVYKIKKDIKEVNTDLLKLKSHVNNAANKKPPLVSKQFVSFLEGNISQAIKGEAHFLKGFMVHFEAVIGYFNNNN